MGYDEEMATVRAIREIVCGGVLGLEMALGDVDGEVEREIEDIERAKKELQRREREVWRMRERRVEEVREQMTQSVVDGLQRCLQLGNIPASTTSRGSRRRVKREDSGGSQKSRTVRREESGKSTGTVKGSKKESKGEPSTQVPAQVEEFTIPSDVSFSSYQPSTIGDQRFEDV